jgi:hypothetical protein
MAASCSSALSKVDQIIGQKSGTYTKVKIKILVILNYRDFLCNYRDYYGPSTKSLFVPSCDLHGNAHHLHLWRHLVDDAEE